MAEALNAFLAMDAAGSPVERRQRPAAASAAHADFLAREAIGSPIDAAELGGPANGMEQGGTGRDADAYPRDLAEQHRRVVAWFEEAERSSAEARRLAERDSDYRHGLQWTKAEQEALRKRGQPELTINYVRRKVELLCGLERKARTDPKAYPRTPREEDRAEAATAALRYVADNNNMPSLRSQVYENILVEGYGGCEVGLEDDGRGGADVTLTYVPWDRLWHDPHSRLPDFADARHLGLVLWMDREQLLDLFPDAGDVAEDSFAPTSGSYDDRPGHVSWQDSKRTRCRVVQCHWTEGGRWWSATATRAGFLAEPAPSPFLDARGRSACPLVLMSAYVDRENNRYGAVRDLISLQDEINKRRSKALHLLTARTVIAEQGAVEDVDRARREVAKPDGYVEVMPGMRFEVDKGQDLAMGQFQLLQHATGEMQASGPNASMAGNDPRDLSGRAILAQQAGGAAQNEPLADALRQWTRRVFEIGWLACRQHWTGERWIRVSDDLEGSKWVGLNRRITLADELGAMEPERRAMAMQSMMLQPNDPRLGMVVRIENDISDLAVDIVVEEGADVPALQAEQFQALTQLAGAMPGLIPPDVLIAASNLKDKDKLLERLQAAQEAQAAGAAGQQQMQEAQLRGQHAKAGADEARALLTQQQAIKTVAETEKLATEAPWIGVGPVGEPKEPEPARPAR